MTLSSIIQSLIFIFALTVLAYVFVYRIEASKDITRMGFKFPYAMRYLITLNLIIALGVVGFLGVVLMMLKISGQS